MLIFRGGSRDGEFFETDINIGFVDVDNPLSRYPSQRYIRGQYHQGTDSLVFYMLAGMQNKIVLQRLVDYLGCHNKPKEPINLTVKKLKDFLNTLPENMEIIECSNSDYGFMSIDSWCVVNAVNQGGNWAMRPHPTMSDQNKGNEKEYLLFE